MADEKLLDAVYEGLRMLDSYETPHIITADIKTEEDRDFWLQMCLNGYVIPVGKPKDE